MTSLKNDRFKDKAKYSFSIETGGVAALAAAFDLTEVDPNGDLYEITIYQLG